MAIGSGNLTSMASSIFTNPLFSTLLCPSSCKSFSLFRTLASSTCSLSHSVSSSSFSSSRVSNSSLHRIFSCNFSATASTTSASVVSTSYPEYGRLLPCPSENGPPRIEHLVVSEAGPVLEYICKALDLPPLYVADLIHFGAVYYALVCPEPPLTATPEQIRIFKEVTAPSVLKMRTSIKGKTVREAQKTFRITHIDEYLEAGTYLRVHVHPKRFPRCYEIDWRSRIIAVTESYVVLDKPAGTSVGGTTDNIEESCATFATRALGLAEPLRTTHQIDNCSEGCVVLARTKEYCSVFHEKIRAKQSVSMILSPEKVSDILLDKKDDIQIYPLHLLLPLGTPLISASLLLANVKSRSSNSSQSALEKKVKKLYLALAAAPVPVGIISHYMRPVNLAPRLISEDFIKRWYLCQLEVLECKKVPWPNSLIKEKYHIEDYGWPNKEFAYECKINLLTGKTHQIRAQLAAYGAPVVGDSMYMPAAIAEMASPGINPFGKFRRHYSNKDDEENAVDEWMAQHGKEPSIAIGLQACEISWDDGEHYYVAGSP
ncbi:LOW QUALITY PROTEIN: Pseudouridine synthase, RsuA/RluA-like, partial [Dillenia turbinata]